MAKNTTSTKAKILKIPDRESLDDFLKEAKQAWRSAHPEAKKKRGAPSKEQAVFQACEGILAEHGHTKKPLTENGPPYEFTPVGEWVRAIKQRVDTTNSNDPDRAIKYHFQSWLLNVNEKLADLPSRILFYAFKINPEFHSLVMLEGLVPNIPWPYESRGEKIPETVKRVAGGIVKLRPYFTIQELLELNAGGYSIDKIVSLFESGHSRGDILKSCPAGSITLEKFWRPARH